MQKCTESLDIVFSSLLSKIFFKRDREKVITGDAVKHFCRYFGAKSKKVINKGLWLSHMLNLFYQLKKCLQDICSASLESF